tara:strand:+ start:3503 stop:5368 length:1866 start_codon:yes stop_codon:yes gene_type:complete
MPLQKLAFKPGVNREKTRYANENGWYECNKIRFRQQLPEKIGGWQRISGNSFQGVCRSLWSWVTLIGTKLVGVGTHLKFYIERGGAYYDITPIRATTTNAATFAATNGSTTITVTDNSHGASVGDFVTFSSAVSLGGVITATILNAEHQIVSVPSANTYTFTSSVAANSSDSGNGGSATDAAYQISVGPSTVAPLTGWGAGTWSNSTWSNGGTSSVSLRLWSQSNFGEDLVFAPRGGALYYWDATNGVSTRGVLVSSLSGASNVPTKQNRLVISDINRFVFCLGVNTLGTSVLDPMLIRWSDQEDVTNWTPSATNQAGSLRLSRGSEIVTAIQSRQALNIWTDSALYSLQYLGGQVVWGAQLVADNISITSPNAVASANGVSYWMGKDKFYMYDGRVQPLPCDLLRYVFSDFNSVELDQVFGGTNEEFHEIWWFYCSADSTTVDKYVIYNYQDKIWYYGTLARTAWLDSGMRNFPLAATYSYNLVNHEEGIDDNETNTSAAISAYITSGEFDLNDGHKFSFVWRVMPDITFDGSTTESPSATMTLYPLQNSGSGYNSPASEGGDSSGAITRSATVPVEAYTNQINTRVRGRQLAVKIESTAAGVQWQLGVPRIDMRADGRR